MSVHKSFHGQPAVVADGSVTPSMHSAGVQKVDDVQERILQELNFLKQNPDVINRPGTAQGVEIEKLRRDKDSLMEENR